MNKDTKRPEWTPEHAGAEFTTSVRDGISTPPSTQQHKSRRKKISVTDYVEGVLRGDRTVLARCITLLESNSSKHMAEAQEVLQKLLPHSGKSIRVGITGVPGAGKSTFIEALGLQLIAQGYHVAVLAIDPSSSLTKGSILGDKTRMEKLSQAANSFIRPSPSAGTLGGVGRKTRETILACEAAGFNVILIETVGVGQSEITVRSMCDFFLLLKIAGAGDELQGIKKGVIELADAILIHKADGNNKTAAELARAEFSQALHYLTPFTRGWIPKVLTASSVTGEGIADVWELIRQFVSQMQNAQIFEQQRQKQALKWLHAMLEEYILEQFYRNTTIQKQLPLMENAVVQGKIPVTSAAQKLLRLFSGFPQHS